MFWKSFNVLGIISLQMNQLPFFKIILSSAANLSIVIFPFTGVSTNLPSSMTTSLATFYPPANSTADLQHVKYKKYEQGSPKLYFRGTKNCNIIRLFHFMHVISQAPPRTHATSLLHAENSMHHFCLWHLLSGTLEWRK